MKLFPNFSPPMKLFPNFSLPMKRFSLLTIALCALVWSGCDLGGSETPTFSVSGTVQNVSDRGVENAQVSLQSASSSSSAASAATTPSSNARPDYQTTAGPDGAYTFEEVEEGRYTLVISASGYDEITSEVTVESDRSLGRETLKGPSDVTGTIVDSQTGDVLSGATVSFNDGDDTALEAADFVTETDANGQFTLEDAATGSYVCVVRIDGYFNAVIPDVEFSEGDVDLGQAASTPGLGESELRVVLSWGETPADLDSHLTGPTASGDRFHVAYFNQSVENANLDLDDVTSYGPETTTIQDYEDGSYRYSVHNYTNQSDDGAVGIAESPARVTVYDQSGQIASYAPPEADAGDGDTWRVFELSVSGGGVSIDDNDGATLGYVDADDSGDTGTFARPAGDVKPALTKEQREAF